MEHATRILIVEDYPDTADHLQSMFEAAGFECDSARTVSQAVEVFNIRCDIGLPCYDGVLLDLSLPDVFGTVLLRAMRDVHPDLPIFVVTAYVDEFVRARCRSANAPLVLKPSFTFDEQPQKPEDVATFRERVIEVVSAYHAEKVSADHPRLILPDVIERLINEAAA